MRSDDDSSSENYTEWAEGQPHRLKGYNFAPITAQKGSLEVERIDGSRSGRVQEVQTALLEGGKERECLLKNYDINAFRPGINASGFAVARHNKSNVTEIDEAYSRY